MSAYATIPDLVNLGIASSAISDRTAQAKLSAIEAASELSDSYLASRYTLPLTSWQSDLTRCVVNIAIYDLLSTRGFSPTPGADERIRQRYEDSIKWLERIAAGTVTPNVTDSTGTSGGGSGPNAGGKNAVISSSSRGLTNRDGKPRFPFDGD